MAGYSGTPLVKKLGIKPGHRVSFLGAPDHFLRLLAPIPARIEIVSEHEMQLDLVVFFTKSHAELSKRFATLAAALVSAGSLWVGWPKKASGVATDLDENLVRDIGLAAGLVDVKVCAIDDVWSGLKFVVRVQDRPKSAKGG